MQFEWTTRKVSLIWLFISYWYLDTAFDAYHRLYDPFKYYNNDISISCFCYDPELIITSNVWVGLISLWIGWGLFNKNTYTSKPIFYIGFLVFSMNLLNGIYLFSEFYLSLAIFSELLFFALSAFTISIINKEYEIALISNFRTFFKLYTPSIFFWSIIVCSTSFLLAKILEKQYAVYSYF